jgi:hypothetical protein
MPTFLCVPKTTYCQSLITLVPTGNGVEIYTPTDLPIPTAIGVWGVNSVARTCPATDGSFWGCVSCFHGT